MKLLILSLFGVALLASFLYTADTPSKEIMTSKSVQVRLLGKDGMPTEPQTVDKVVKTDAEWRQQLTSEQYQIARGKGTERAFCGAFFDHKKPGYYA